MPGGAPGNTTDCAPGDEGRYLVVLFRPGCNAIPAQAVVQGQVGQHVPAILREQSDIFVPRIEGVELALVVLAGHADQKVGKVDAGFLSGENEASIELSDGVGIDLVDMELSPELDRVVAQHLGEGVGDLIGIVGLDELVGCGAGREAVEVQVLDALSLGIESDNAGCAVGIRKALRNQAYVPRRRPADRDWCRSRIKLRWSSLTCRGTERLGIAQSDQLRPAGGDGIEARNAGAALRHRIRIIEIEVVDKVVGGKQAPSAIRIDADRALVIAHNLVEGGGSKAVGGIRSRDVLEHALCRN